MCIIFWLDPSDKNSARWRCNYLSTRLCPGLACHYSGLNLAARHLPEREVWRSPGWIHIVLPKSVTKHMAWPGPNLAALSHGTIRSVWVESMFHYRYGPWYSDFCMGKCGHNTGPALANQYRRLTIPDISCKFLYRVRIINSYPNGKFTIGVIMHQYCKYWRCHGIS